MISNLIIGVIGGGNLAKAMVEGILKKVQGQLTLPPVFLSYATPGFSFMKDSSIGIHPPIDSQRLLSDLVNSSQIIVSAPSEKTLEFWKTLSVHTTHCNADVINKADIIILAFKPHQLVSALSDVRPLLVHPLPSKLYVSVLAGVSSETLCSNFQYHICNPFNGRIIRVMPSILAMIGESCSAVAAHSSATLEDVTIVKQIFNTLGKCEVVPEKLISAVTGLSGSGPAYIFMVIEALSDGGVKQGLPRNLATTFAAQTVLGAAKMVLETNKHPSQLKDDVCSAGGTTIHAVHALEKGGLRATIMNAVEAATNRADEMS